MKILLQHIIIFIIGLYVLVGSIFFISGSTEVGNQILLKWYKAYIERPLNWTITVITPTVSAPRDDEYARNAARRAARTGEENADIIK